jgi:hypothetical protein
MIKLDNVNLNPIPWIKGGIIALITVIFLTYVGCNTITTVPADEIWVKQDVVGGDLQFWTQPGMQNKAFGRVTEYTKSAQYSFSSHPDQGTTGDQSIKVRFNDGGHGNISGTLRWEMPTDDAHLTALHTKFGSYHSIEQQLIRPVVERAVYMSGPLMSSKESSAERRSDLIQYIEDQVVNGVYKTKTEEKRVKDALSGQERTVTYVRLSEDASQPNGIARQEKSPLAMFGIKTYSFNINSITYDKAVEAQIASQQALVMQVQTAIANARKAEQDAITSEKQGQADAAKAKWAQEVLKATEVGAAEKNKSVAEVEWSQKILVANKQVEAANLFKTEQTLLGEGEAARRLAVMQADGALEKKLAAWVDVQKAWAAEVGKQRWVPEIQFNGTGNGGGDNQALTLMQIIAAKAAKDLQLDPTIHPVK